MLKGFPITQLHTCNNFESIWNTYNSCQLNWEQMEDITLFCAGRELYSISRKCFSYIMEEYTIVPDPDNKLVM